MADPTVIDPTLIINHAPVVSAPVTGAAAPEGSAIIAYDHAALLAHTTDPDVSDVLSIVVDPSQLPAGVVYQHADSYSYDTVIDFYWYGIHTFIPTTVVVPVVDTLTINANDPAYQSLAQGETLDVTVNYAVTDGFATTPAQAIFHIVGLNDAPVISAPVAAVATEDGAAVSLDALANATDVDHGSVLSVVAAPLPAVSGVGTGSANDIAVAAAAAPPTILALDPATLPPGVSFDAATNSFSIDPTNAAYQHLGAGQTQLVTVDYGVTDGMVVTAAQAVFTVTGVNDAPVATGPVTGVFVNEGVGTGSYDLAALTSTTFDPDQNSTLTVTIDAASLPDGVSFVSTPEQLIPGYTIPAYVIPAGPRGTSWGGYIYPAQYVPAQIVPDQIIPATTILTIDPSNAAFQSLAQGEEMQVVVNYMVTDGEFSTPAQAIFTVNGMNDAPVVSGPVIAGAMEGGAVVTVDALANATDIDHGSVLSVVAAPLPPVVSTGGSANDIAEATALAAAAPVTPLPFDAAALPAGVSFDAATHSFSIDPTDAAYQHLAAGQTQQVTINYGVTDGLTVTTASVVLTVTGTNDAPVVSAPVHATAVAGNGPVALTMADLLANATDADTTDILNVVDIPAILPAGVTEVISTGGVIAVPDPTAYYGIRYDYQPAGHSLTIDPSDPAYQSLAAGETLDVTVNYGVSDGTVTTATSAVFTVVGINDAPVVATPAHASAIEDGAAVVLDALATATDVDHGAALSVVDVPTILPAGVSYDAATHSFTLDPANAAYQSLSAGQTQAVTVAYGVSDGMATTPTTAVFTVTGTNDTPIVAAPQAFAVLAGSAAFTLNPLANVSDIDAKDVLHLVPGSLADGVHSVTVPGGYYQPDITITQFNPNDPAFKSLAAGEVATVTWNYAVTDGTATVQDSAVFTVTGVNDAPIVSAPVGGTVLEDSAVYTVNALANATDVDHGAVLNVVNVPAILPAGVTYDAAMHSFSINPADAAFQQLAQGETQQVIVTYGVSDGMATTAANVVFTVIGTNDVPVISGPVTSTPNEGSGIVTVNATGNATDVDAHQGLHATGVPSVLPAGVTFDAATDRFQFDSSNPAYDSLAKGESLDVVVNYTIFDGFVEVPTSIIFSVQGTNDTPIVSGQVQAGTVTQSAAPMAIDLLALASDVDHGTVLSVKTTQGSTITASVTSGTWGAPIAFTQANGILTIDPAQFKALGAGESLDIVFNYTITDGNANGNVAASAHLVVTGQNDAPAGIAISQSHVAENSVAGTVVGMFSALDPDRTDSFAYQIVNDPSGFFAVSGNSLVVAQGALLDYETQTSHSIDVMVTDAAGVSFTKTIVIAVDDVLGVVIFGTSGNDIFNATNGTPRPTPEGDTINGNNGNDLLDGLAGNDIINGGAGDDTLIGGLGNDILDGGVGNDNVSGGAGNDVIIVRGTEALGDTIDGGSGIDSLQVDGSAALTLNNFNATTSSIENWVGNGHELVGTGGNNVFDLSGLTNVSGLTFVDGLAGDDTLIGSSFADDLRGNDGNDFLNGGAGNDILTGGKGNDNVQGGAGDDRIVIAGNDGVGDIFNGGTGTDTLVATGSSSLTLTGFNATAQSIEVWEGNGKGVLGTSAAETFDFSGITAITGAGMGFVDAGDGADMMIGSSFADDLRGNSGNDVINGGAGNDILNGGAGNDILNGGIGSDVLTGGANNDIFVFNKPAAGSGVDSITDFTIGADKIGLVAADFGLFAGPLAAGDFVLGTAANAAHQQFIYDAASKTLFWDADGTGATAAVALTTFTTAPALQLTDLILV